MAEELLKGANQSGKVTAMKRCDKVNRAGRMMIHLSPERRLTGPDPAKEKSDLTRGLNKFLAA